ncbi:MAG: hypothetical protein ACF8MF_13755 [Phycisphaerales bacterium JB052]
MGEAMDAGAYTEQYGEKVDLRRRRETRMTDHLVRRAHWLEQEDRELILAVFDRGQSAVSIAKMKHLPVRHVRKQIRHLVDRLNDPRVAYVVAHHNSWNPTMQAIGHELFVQGRTMREVCKDLGLSLHCVRKNRDAIEAMALAKYRPSPSRAWKRAKRSGA